MSFLRQATSKNTTRRRYGSWKQVPAEAVIQVEETQKLSIYVARLQATVAEWMYTRPIFDACT